MMGGEFCGKALRSAARAWTAAHPDALGRALPYEISGCDRPLSVTADESGSVRASMPLPLSVERWNGLDTAVFPGIVHALCVGREPDEDHARKLTSALAAVWTAPAAGVMYLDREGRTMRPAVWVRDTDTLFFESSCASGSAAAAAILSRAQPDGESVWPLRQPGGVILASARREDGRLTELAISGPVGLEPPFAAEL